MEGAVTLSDSRHKLCLHSLITQVLMAKITVVSPNRALYRCASTFANVDICRFYLAPTVIIVGVLEVLMLSALMPVPK